MEAENELNFLNPTLKNQYDLGLLNNFQIENLKIAHHFCLHKVNW